LAGLVSSARFARKASIIRVASCVWRISSEEADKSAFYVDKSFAVGHRAICNGPFTNPAENGFLLIADYTGLTRIVLNGWGGDRKYISICIHTYVLF